MSGWEPLLGGMYLPGRLLGTRKYDYRTLNNLHRWRALLQPAKETRAIPFQIVLAWMMNSDPPIYPVVAADIPAQLIEDLAAADLELTAEQMERLNHPPPGRTSRGTTSVSCIGPCLFAPRPHCIRRSPLTGWRPSLLCDPASL